NSHDILGTYKAILQSRQSPVIAESADAFVSRLLIGLRLLKARCGEECVFHAIVNRVSTGW
ncbi:MAG: hypothetical protein WBE65_00535, partial [Steroidobacteraceae bacterium]